MARELYGTLQCENCIITISCGYSTKSILCSQNHFESRVNLFVMHCSLIVFVTRFDMQCTIELTGSSVATYIARDEPVPFPGPSEDDSSSMGFFDKLKGAEGMSEDMEPKGSAVKVGGEPKAITFNTKREIEFELVKYEEPNHIWRVPGAPQYCVCPSP